MLKASGGCGVGQFVSSNPSIHSEKWDWGGRGLHQEPQCNCANALTSERAAANNGEKDEGRRGTVFLWSSYWKFSIEVPDTALKTLVQH